MLCVSVLGTSYSRHGNIISFAVNFEQKYYRTHCRRCEFGVTELRWRQRQMDFICQADARCGYDGLNDGCGNE